MRNDTSVGADPFPNGRNIGRFRLFFPTMLTSWPPVDDMHHHEKIARIQGDDSASQFLVVATRNPYGGHSRYQSSGQGPCSRQRRHSRLWWKAPAVPAIKRSLLPA